MDGLSWACLHYSDNPRVPFAPQRGRWGWRALPLLRVSLTAPAPVSAPLGLLDPPEACCCGAAGVVSGPFGRSSGVQPPRSAACGYPPRGWQLVPLGQGQGLPLQTTHSDTRSSSSLGMMSGDVLPG